MSQEKNPQLSGFKINNLILLESNLKREAAVNFNDPKKETDLAVDVEVSVKESIINVILKIEYTQTFEKKVEVLVSIKMAGIFEKIGDTELDLEEFGRVNGAAIIFPYVREHLTGLIAKAGLGLLILPPINFTKK